MVREAQLNSAGNAAAFPSRTWPRAVGIGGSFLVVTTIAVFWLAYWLAGRQLPAEVVLVVFLPSILIQFLSVLSYLNRLPKKVSSSTRWLAVIQAWWFFFGAIGSEAVGYLLGGLLLFTAAWAQSQRPRDQRLGMAAATWFGLGFVLFRLAAWWEAGVLTSPEAVFLVAVGLAQLIDLAGRRFPSHLSGQRVMAVWVGSGGLTLIVAHDIVYRLYAFVIFSVVLTAASLVAAIRMTSSQYRVEID